MIFVDAENLFSFKNEETLVEVVIKIITDWFRLIRNKGELIQGIQLIILWYVFGCSDLH